MILTRVGFTYGFHQAELIQPGIVGDVVDASFFSEFPYAQLANVSGFMISDPCYQSASITIVEDTIKDFQLLRRASLIKITELWTLYLI